MMKRLLTISSLTLLASIVLSGYYVSMPVLAPHEAASDSIKASPERLQQDVEFLCNTTQPRNWQNTYSLNTEAAGYIKNEWKKLGLTVAEQPYKVFENEYKNLITSFGPANGERIIVGAHYDVCGNQAGADDNASGTAGLLELARLLKEHEPELNYRVDLVAYTLEEPPFFRTEDMGSAVHANSVHNSNQPIKGMICLEMIGYYSDEKKSQEYPLGILKLFYPNKGNFIAVVGKIGQGTFTRRVKKRMKAGSEIDVRSINAPAKIPGIDFSDHLNYWKYDYDAVMITNTAFYRNKEYHQPGDTPERLDYNKMSEVVKGVYWTITTLK